MKHLHLAVIVLIACALVSITLAAQQISTSVPTTEVTVPRLIKFSGVLKDANGLPRIGTVAITFTLNAAQEGGDLLWSESQIVNVDEQGHYTVFLGTSEKEGLPLDVFSNGKAQWLGIQTQGEEEQPRVLLVAVPYALKAADADTLGGKPLSSFVTYEDLAKSDENGSRRQSSTLQRTIAVPGSRAASSTTTGSRSTTGKGVQFLASDGIIVPSYSEAGNNTWFGSYAGQPSSGTNNSFFGSWSGYSTSSGSENTFLGYCAGCNNASGAGNTVAGAWSGYHNTAGGNSFFGYYAGYTNTTGTQNSFFGNHAGYKASTNGSNSFFGDSAGYNNTASQNSFFGTESGYTNTSGTGLAFFGYQAGNANTASDNSFFGYQAGYSNTGAAANAFFGYKAGRANTGANNSFFGTNAGTANTAAYENSFFGTEAGKSNTTGVDNTFFGYRAGTANLTGDVNAYFGSNTGLFSTGWGNVFVGADAGRLNTSGYWNSFLGGGVGFFNTTGYYNVFAGTTAGYDNSSGSQNTFLGYQAGHNNSAGGNTIENNNTFIGASTLGAVGITNATAIGYLARVTQSNSLVLGSINGVNGASADTYVGIGTTNPYAKLDVIGTIRSYTPNESTSNLTFKNDAAPSSWQLSSYNVGDLRITEAGIGPRMVIRPTSGNVGIGTVFPAAKLEVNGSIRANPADENTAGFWLANQSAPSAWQMATYNSGKLYINEAGVATRMVIASSTGNVGIGTTDPSYKLHVAGSIYATGSLLSSDARLKKNISDLRYGLYEILQLHPVSYLWKDQTDSKLNLGLIAQEVEPIFPELVERAKDEAGTMSLNYVGLVPVLVRAIQQQQGKLGEQQAALAQKDTEIAALNARLTALEQMMERLVKQEVKQEK